MKNSRNLLPAQLGDAHIRLLRIFRAVVEGGGFTAAEVTLNISRPAISQAIHELESLLMMRLCHRGRAGFSLTEQGEAVYQAALQLLASLETFRASIHAINTELSGELNIGITDNMVTVPQMLITRSLAALKRRGPNITINIRMVSPAAIEGGVIDGRLQVGVVPEIKTLPSLDYCHLYDELSLLYCSNEHPLFVIADDCITDADIVSADAVIAAYPQATAVQQLQGKLNARASSTDREGIAFLILSGEYIGFLPTHFAERWQQQGRLRPLQPQQRFFRTGFAVITRKGARPNLVLEAYREELQRCTVDANAGVCGDGMGEYG